jgi:DNA-binding response OmpR family regulator
MYRMKFESEGFDVQIADNGADGVSLVETFSPDIVLLDIQLPVLSGPETLRAIRSHTWGKQVPVLILTNLGETEAPADLPSLGIAGYAVKADLTPSQVVERVKTVLGC